MNKIYTTLVAALGLTIGFNAQADVIDFESNTGYTAIGVYDTWENSPFRTGTLTGNVAVCDNPDTAVSEITGEAANASEKVLGAQRSRFGSNTFGVRIDLAEPFEFKNEQQYVHVNMWRPNEGRVMLIGLGKRTDWTDQPTDVEQFWVLSKNTVATGAWSDAVFSLNGSGDIMIYSLVIVPECESPHKRTEDFLFYVDNIEVNTTARPNITPSEYYGTNFDKETTVLTDKGSSETARRTSVVGLKKTSLGLQSTSVPQASELKIYFDLTSTAVFSVKAGETLRPYITYGMSSWMNAYLYIDLDQNGIFDVLEDSHGDAVDGSELVTYNKGTGSGATPSLPTYKLPADTKPGLYRMRYKIDYENVDAGGNDNIASDGGSIVDVMLHVYEDGGTATVNDYQLNGEVLAANGDKLNAYEVPAMTAFEIMMAPEKGFGHNGVDVVFGYDLNGDATDKYGNPNYFTNTYLFSSHTTNYTLPATVMFGNVRIEGHMIEESQLPVFDLNFETSLATSRTDRYLSTMTFTVNGDEATTYSIPSVPTTVYQRLTTSEEPLVVERGDEVVLTVNYTGNAMHSYIYADWNQDWMLDNSIDSDGIPTGEMLAYTYYSNKNSNGETVAAAQLPSAISNFPFTIPTDIVDGTYYGRYKIDWDNIDPAGQYSGTNNIDDNGGFIVDFAIKVEGGVYDGIQEVVVDNENNDTYDLQGRRSEATQPGVYIVNGQKVIR